MKQFYSFLMTGIAVLLICSCGKKIDGDTIPQPPTNPPPTSPQTTQQAIMRNWAFVSMDVKHEYIEEKTIGLDRLKRVVKTAYTTTKNAGSCLFDQTKATSQDLAYEVNTTEKIWMYRNDTLLSNTDAPLVFNIAHSGLVSDYAMISTDSLRMNSGPIKIKPNVVPQVVSVKLRFENENLYMIYKLLMAGSPGGQVTETEHADVIITLKKK